MMQSKNYLVSKIRSKITFVRLLRILFLIYCFIDIPHFFIYRVTPTYSSITEAYYEAHQISYLKWIFCLFILFGLHLNQTRRKISQYLILSTALGILVLFVLKGPLTNLLLGSIVCKIGLLEVGGILALMSLFSGQKKDDSFSSLEVLITFLLSIGLYSLLIFQFPTVIPR